MPEFSDTPPPYDLEALRRGDPAAFEALVRAESPRLFRFLLRLLGDREAAQSVMQEAFLQAFRRIDSFRGDSRLTTWLYGIALNQARVLLRKTRRYTPMDEADLDRLQPAFSQGMYAQRYRPWPPDVLAEREDLRRLVREAIDRLPDTYREVLLLRDIEGFSTEEVAQLLNLSEGAVRVRLHRARQALRALLSPHIEKEDL
ncbi:RNA polymerase sigma factor [Rhodothermus profundi]|uniref:RNA polymerase, sigma subunit, ECF family n=1 Tax=Rhodothermus profundi TaxID=633813 RepID=A0A1M6QC82_9BACT|nr:sigma-70 family RNA polymerase sigma factor [Rhodothermus profundi]SHK17776.1 RNA polymerase, sigma subunit, ECF family [Rhodothermus profundi]